MRAKGQGAREQTISDVEIIRLYLIDKGVPEKDINILDKYPSSTYENVLLVMKSLEKIGADSIIFITAPYHSLRSKLLWKKNAAGIKVYVPPVSDTPPNYIQWKTTINQKKVIIYEYLAIVYNWYLGRL